ncbi:MAG: peptide transporter [Epsilonproteobacteria bacterium]|nr:peptide transporter [Campylobacterota bacterium]
MKIIKEKSQDKIPASINKIILLIVIAFVFSVATRMIWVYELKDVEQFKFNNELMINTNDGYYYAEGARDRLAGTHQENDLSPIESSASILAAGVVKITPFNIETVLLYLPAIFGSLLVIPLILIGHSINRVEVGFIAALVGSIANSYYNRTMVGYYDTDLLNIVFPTILMWSLAWALKTREDKYILLMAVDIIAYRWWYAQSYSLEFAFFGLLLVYAIYEYIKKEDYKFTIILLTFMMFSISGLDILYRILIVILMFILLHYKKEIFQKYMIYLFLASIITFFASGIFDLIWGRLQSYVFDGASSLNKGELNLHFYTVVQTIREAGSISFVTFGERISGSIFAFLLSFGGYIWLCKKHPIMLLGLPLAGLGFLALSSGLRFTIYAVPVMALGIGFFISEFSRKVSNQRIIQIVVSSIFTILVLVPNINHIVEYKVPPVFTKDEVVVLDKLKSIASREDYVVGWWDYGYPIRYYADVKTLSDGGKHTGEVNFPTSFALTNPQDVAAKMLRLDVEYTEKKFALGKSVKDEIDLKRTNIASMTIDNGFKDTNDFLHALSGDIKMLPKTRDVYLFLPSNMLNIYSTVKLFSNIDLMSGLMGKNPFLYKTSEFSENGEFIEFGNGVRLSNKDGLLQVGQNSIKLKRFVRTEYISKEKLNVDIQNVAYDGELNVIYMANYRQFLIVDEDTYNSTYFQLFVLEQYDNTLFEPTILTPMLKVYKLKI